MIGIFSKTTDSNFVEAAGEAGLDFIILDQEHGLASQEMLHNHSRAAKIAGMKAIVRVKGVDANAIGAALDAGADGVQVPNISTVEQVHAVIQAARFFPLGMRGVCRFVRAAQFGKKDKEQYFSGANQATLVLQVEGKEGIEKLDDILKIDGYDVLFIGPYDLSQSLGIPGQVDHPMMLELLDDIAAKAAKAGKKLGTFVDTPKMGRLLSAKGFDYLAYSVDVSIFREACATIISNLNDE
ncbi:MAG: aldolase [Sphingobacteriales bacterium]|nr:MAG: aldolase [Sphingobacteriales bacterium]